MDLKTREKQAIADAEVTMTRSEFEVKFPASHIRRSVSKGELTYFGYYAFLDPANGKKTIVR
ncbi:MAG: hypothetical protein IMZ61_04030 [Planctomycetes bacterium]|nr:hypothetical protein [Planctomycetota bacterium]